MAWQTDHWEWEDSYNKYWPLEPDVDLIPHTSGSLGDGDNHWDSAFIDVLNVGSSVATSLNPDEDGMRDLGIDAEFVPFYWRSGYFYHIKLRQELTLLEDFCSINGSLVPLTSGDFNIGKKTIEDEVVTITRWKDAYLTTLDVAGDVAISGDGNALKLYYGEHFVGLKAPSSMIASSTYTLPAAMGDTGQVLSLSGTPTPGQLAWVNAATGNVRGPETATANDIPIFASTTSLLDSGVKIEATTKNLLPDSSGTTKDLGSSVNRWGTAYLGAVDVTGNVTVEANGSLSLFRCKGA